MSTSLSPLLAPMLSSGPMRAVFEVMGVTDIVAKSLGSSNPYNMVRATLDALGNAVHTTQVADLREDDGCTSESTSTSQGDMTYTLWSDCSDGSSVGFAVYSAGVHSFPRPPVSYPAASQVIWAWINGTTTIKAQPTAP